MTAETAARDATLATGTMQNTLRTEAPAKLLATLAIVAVMLVCAYAVRSGSSAMMILAFAALIPVAALIAVTRPLIFPYGLYVLLVPFDNLLGAGSFGTLTKLLGILTTICLAVWCVRTRSFIAPGKAALPLALLMGWIALSTFWAIDQGAAFAIVPTYAGLIAMFLLLAATPLNLKTYRLLIGAVMISGVFSAAYGANAFFHDPSLREQALAVRRLVLHAGDIIIDPNHFADAMLFPAAALIVTGLRTRLLTGKLLCAAGTALIAGAIALSGSREGMAGLALILVYLLFRSRKRKQIALIGALALGATFFTQTSIWVRFSSVFASGGSGRQAIWGVGWAAFKHAWLAGYGIGNFPIVYDRYYLQVYQSYTNGFSSPAHNIVMHYLVETGIVGMFLVGWFLWEQLRSLRFIGRDHPLYDDRIMLEAAMVAILFVALSIDLFHYKYTWLLFAAVAQLRSMALTMRLTESSRPQVSRTNAEPSAPAVRHSSGIAAQRSI